MRSLWIVVLIAILAGCSSPTEAGLKGDESTAGVTVDGVSLTVARSAYRHGDNARVQLVNGSTRSIGYNTCMAAREYWNGTSWLRVESLRICTDAFYPLSAGQSVSFEEPVTSEWQPGSYRIVLRVNRSDSNSLLDLATTSFTVSQ